MKSPHRKCEKCGFVAMRNIFESVKYKQTLCLRCWRCIYAKELKLRKKNGLIEVPAK